MTSRISSECSSTTLMFLINTLRITPLKPIWFITPIPNVLQNSFLLSMSLMKCRQQGDEMSDLVKGYPAIDFQNMVTDYLKANKAEDYGLDDLRGMFYTDGGSRTINSVNYGGWGVHGYLFVTKETNSNSGCKKATPTTKDYTTGKLGKNDTKAFVAAYIDYYGQIDNNSTNNIAELMGMLRCLFLINQIGLQHSTIHADSKYVLSLLEGRETYKNNGFKTAAGKDLANKELCMQLIEMFDEVTQKYPVDLKWVKGHSGEYGNECADANATKGCYLAANKLRDVVIKTDEHIRDDFNIDGDFLHIATPDEYFGKEHESPKMLSENSLFFTTNGIDIRNSTTYYQASFGKMLNGKDKDERRKLRGKPFADCCVSVVELKEPNPVINNIINIVTEHFPITGVVECNLSYQTRQSIYSDLLQGGLNTVQVDINKGSVLLPNKEEIATIVNPARQSFNLINDFNEVKEFLDRYMRGNMYGIDSVTEVTDYFYEIKENKNGKVSYKVLEHEEGFVKIPVEFKYREHTIQTTIPITIGVDTPSRVSLGRMKTIEPKMSLVTWDTTGRELRFAILIETCEGIGVWMGIYSNIHLH